MFDIMKYDFDDNFLELFVVDRTDPLEENNVYWVHIPFYNIDYVVNNKAGGNTFSVILKSGVTFKAMKDTFEDSDNDVNNIRMRIKTFYPRFVESD